MTGLPDRLARYATAFAAAGAQFGIDPYLLAAVCDRESLGGEALTPKGPGGLGDNGHAHGLMAIDDRSWAQWLATHPWWEPECNISKGAEILAANVARFEVGFFYDALFAAVAAYNAGPGNVRAALAHAPKGLPPLELRRVIDSRTAHGNYATDCFHRWESFRSPKE